MYLVDFYKKYPQNLLYNVKRACSLHFILVGISSSSILSVRNSGVGKFLLSGQNLLSMKLLVIGL